MLFTAPRLETSPLTFKEIHKGTAITGSSGVRGIPVCVCECVCTLCMWSQSHFNEEKSVKGKEN